MPSTFGPGEHRYTIRRRVFQVFGAGFEIFDAQGQLEAYCHQKAFKLREDIRLYTDKSRSTELLTMKARKALDFSATYDIALSTGELLGSLRRKGMKSTFIRDEWLIFGPDDEPIGTITERGGTLSFLRRWSEWASLLSPQKYDLMRTADGAHLATFRQLFNPFVYRLAIESHQDDELIDDLILIAAGTLLAAIEGRQG